jgi:hypothetical protein
MIRVMCHHLCWFSGWTYLGYLLSGYEANVEFPITAAHLHPRELAFVMLQALLTPSVRVKTLHIRSHELLHKPRLPKT